MNLNALTSFLNSRNIALKDGISPVPVKTNMGKFQIFKSLLDHLLDMSWGHLHIAHGHWHNSLLVWSENNLAFRSVMSAHSCQVLENLQSFVGSDG